jgi:predicted amidohydrolase YtcJ
MSPPPASLAIVNARVWTGDPRRPWADAVLVHGARIEAVGSSAEVRKRTDGLTVVVDARRMLVTRSPRSWDSGLVGRGEAANLVVLRADPVRFTAEDVQEVEVALEVREGRVVADPDGLAR